MAFTRISLPLSFLILLSLLAIAFASDYGYDGIPADSPQAKPVYNGSKPNYCTVKSEGALTKVLCKAVDEVLGVVKTVPVCSVATDAKGYFYAIVSSKNKSNLKLKDCKAFLQTSPIRKCNVPTDINKGIIGFPLSGDYRILHDKRTNLYSARPFFFTSYEPKQAAPNGY